MLMETMLPPPAPAREGNIAAHVSMADTRSSRVLPGGGCLVQQLGP